MNGNRPTDFVLIYVLYCAKLVQTILVYFKRICKVYKSCGFQMIRKFLCFIVSDPYPTQLDECTTMHIWLGAAA